MSDAVSRGPRNPSRLVVVASVVAAAAVGLLTGRVWAFTVALVGCAALLCAGYAVLRRRLGWKPLEADDLLRLIGVMHP